MLLARVSSGSSAFAVMSDRLAPAARAEVACKQWWSWRSLIRSRAEPGCLQWLHLTCKEVKEKKEKKEKKDKKEKKEKKEKANQEGKPGKEKKEKKEKKHKDKDWCAFVDAGGSSLNLGSRQDKAKKDKKDKKEKKKEKKHKHHHHKHDNDKTAVRTLGGVLCE